MLAQSTNRLNSRSRQMRHCKSHAFYVKELLCCKQHGLHERKPCKFNRNNNCKTPRTTPFFVLRACAARAASVQAQDTLLTPKRSENCAPSSASPYSGVIPIHTSPTNYLFSARSDSAVQPPIEELCSGESSILSKNPTKSNLFDRQILQFLLALLAVCSKTFTTLSIESWQLPPAKRSVDTLFSGAILSKGMKSILVKHFFWSYDFYFRFRRLRTEPF